jgi:hypothetical protein
MAPTTILFIASGVFLVLAFLLSAKSITLLFLLLFAITFAGAILRRPKEQAQRRMREWEASASTWGAGIGPMPGDTAPVIQPSSFPPTLSRSYRGRGDEARRYRDLDAQMLAERGYFPTSENYVPGQWRPVDWLAAILFGLIWVILLIVVKPAGTVTVIYTRSGQQGMPGVAPAWRGQPAAAASPQSVAQDITARLATLDGLRSSGAIAEDEWRAKRQDILNSL